MIGIDKIAAPGTDHQKHIDGNGLSHRADQSRARRDAPFPQGTAQLNPLRTAPRSSNRRFDGIDTNLKVHSR